MKFKITTYTKTIRTYLIEADSKDAAYDIFFDNFDNYDSEDLEESDEELESINEVIE